MTKKISNENQETPQGFFYFPDFISKKEEQALLSEIDKINWQVIKMHGVVAKRKVMHYGLDYTYTNRTVKPTILPPEFLQSLIRRCGALMKINPSEIVEILISKYPTAAGIGWHRDALIFGDKVLGVSLGSSSVMKFRIKNKETFEVVKKILEQRSAYILSGSARTKWQHSISPVKNLRYSITFRTLRKK